MKILNLKNGLLIAALLASGEALSGLGEREWRGAEQTIAPSPHEKAQARNALDQLIASLSGVDAAYTSGNSNEARARLEEATFSWNKVSAAISTREAREPKLLLNSLHSEVRSGAPTTEVNSTIYVRWQPSFAARAIASAGVIASFGLVIRQQSAKLNRATARRRAFAQRRRRAASPQPPGQEISDTARSGR